MSLTYDTIAPELGGQAWTTIRAGSSNGTNGKIGFGIIHMIYEGPDRNGWQSFYRDIHRQLEARWPRQISYIEGEFGRSIERPEWLGSPGQPNKSD